MNNEPICTVGDYGRCGCGDACLVMGEVVAIEWNTDDDHFAVGWLYTIKWDWISETGENLGVTYDQVPHELFEVTAITLHPHGICEIPL